MDGMLQFILCREHLWGYQHVSSAYKEPPEESAQRIMNYMKEIYPIAPEKNIRKVLGL